jgi:molybdopterin-guanine dinucleotide biosynthesis protein A
MDAIILAGGETPELLKTALGSDAPVERALLQVQGHHAIEYVLESLRDVPQIDQVIVVGLPGTLELVSRIAPDVVRVQAASSLTDNVLAGMEAANSQQFLLCTCDIPLVTSKTWREFLDKAGKQNLAAAYPIAEKGAVERMFPGGKRTYATLIEGTFTGGNAFVLQPENEAQLTQLVEAAYSVRKNPLGLARLLGLRFVWKALRKKLSILELQNKMSELLQCRAGAVVMDDVTIAFDIDKKEDYDLAEKVLGQTRKGTYS